LTKIALGYILGYFLHTHLVTLAVSIIRVPQTVSLRVVAEEKILPGLPDIFKPKILLWVNFEGP
jgi:hypothetical protein